ncbi:Uncharacterized protein C4F10.09c [Grifola frondosa]|uniref:Uncharacterized protein C4F10.09c n=1 Tax=Grifola frondosa TaxID=5627 RepID=A0A1C7MA34_GRIFR|nr:Uncharacterized protein C4F10.09c [Grifola frondosa]
MQKCVQLQIFGRSLQTTIAPSSEVYLVRSLFPSSHGSPSQRQDFSQPLARTEAKEDSKLKSKLVTGPQDNDPALLNDVSSFLNNLKDNKTGDDAVKPATKEKHHKRAGKHQDQPHKSNHFNESHKKSEGDKPHRAKPDAKSKGSKKSPIQQESGADLHDETKPKKKHGTKFVLEPTPQWYTALPALSPTSDPLPASTPAQLTSLTARAQDLLTTDAAAYQASAASTGASALSALTLLVQASPAHNIRALETLRGMAERGRGKGGREEGLKAVRCVVDWWVGGGAPGRKLRYFRDQPLLHADVADARLLLWAFEDWLKKFFFSILQILETYSLDPLTYVRTQALAFIATLLRAQPEQEQNLLRLLVNKLGDTEKAVCSRASYHLLQVLQAHPAMKAVIVREVHALAFRLPASSAAAARTAAENASAPVHKHIRFDDDDEKEKAKGKAKEKEQEAKHMERWNTHAWYYAAVTLNQVVLTPAEGDRAVARTLIAIYFEMFQEILGSGRSQEVEGGADVDGHSEAAEGEDDGKAAGFTEIEDASSRLISAILTGVNRALPFAKVDAGGGDAVFKKHIDTLFLITHTSTTTLAPAASSSSFATALTDRFYRTLYASLTDARLATSNKQAMYLNLLFKALKADRNVDRVKAFVRRFVQVLAVGVGGGGGVEFVAGGLYLLGELFSTTPELKGMLSISVSKKSAVEGEEYDPRKRDPQYAHASASPIYELVCRFLQRIHDAISIRPLLIAPLLNHYHPTIALHARQLLTSAPMTATPDLSLNTLSHFLDRFVYKNPKKPKTKGTSAMQPAASGADGASGVKLVRGEVAGMGVPVNEEQFWRKRAEDVPVDQQFFYKFFVRKNEKERQMAAKVEKRKARGDASHSEAESDDEESEDGGFELGSDSGAKAESDAVEVDEEGEGSDQEEAEIWKAMQATMPAELQDDDLMEDSDELPSGLEDNDSDGFDQDEDEAECLEEPEAEDKSAEGHAEEGDDNDDFSLVEASDAEDLLSLDAEVPMGLIEYDGSDAESDEGEGDAWGGIGESATKKRKRDEDSGKRRKKLKSLPTFASYEDYAKMIEDGPEDNI